MDFEETHEEPWKRVSCENADSMLKAEAACTSLEGDVEVGCHKEGCVGAMAHWECCGGECGALGLRVCEEAGLMKKAEPACTNLGGDVEVGCHKAGGVLGLWSIVSAVVECGAWDGTLVHCECGVGMMLCRERDVGL